MQNYEDDIPVGLIKIRTELNIFVFNFIDYLKTRNITDFPQKFELIEMMPLND